MNKQPIEPQKPEVEIWNKIISEPREYLIEGEPDQERYTYNQALNKAREKASKTKQSVQIITYYQNSWWDIDVAYPSIFAD